MENTQPVVNWKTDRKSDYRAVLTAEQMQRIQIVAPWCVERKHNAMVFMDLVEKAIKENYKVKEPVKEKAVQLDKRVQEIILKAFSSVNPRTKKLYTETEIKEALKAKNIPNYEAYFQKPTEPSLFDGL